MAAARSAASASATSTSTITCVWIDPDNTDHLLEGCDGGLYETLDGGRLWRHFTNLSVTQFYNVDVDNASPIYNIYGGTQDNSTLGGPSRSKGQAVTNNDWFIVTGGDGFVSRIDPTDPNIVYGESQYGGVVRLDRRTSERVSIRPAEDRGESAYRFNWETPFIISPHSPTRLYFGASRLLRSDDRGNTWKPISPDLTRQTDRNTLPVMGRIWTPEAIAQHQSTATWGNISAISESRKREGLLYVGTDDGLVQISLDSGASWRKSERVPGLPDYGNYGVYVNRLYAGKSDENVVYGVWENTKNGDFKPYLYRSCNRGGSWESIAGDLPTNGPVLSFAEDHVNPNLLFAGTEFGLFFTVDGGKKWVRMRGNLPTIAVRDMVIQERENDLVLGDVRPRLLRPRRLHAAADVVAGHVRSRRPDLPVQGGGDRSAGDRPLARLARRVAVDGGESPARRDLHLLDQGHAAIGAAASHAGLARRNQGRHAVSDAGAAHRRNG